MNRHGLVSLGISFGLLFVVSCGQKSPTNTVNRGTTGTVDGNSSTGTGSTGSNDTTSGGNKGTVTLPSAQVGKAQDFFTNKVLPLVKSAPCTNCHADPREPVQQQGGLAPQNFTTMFGFLKDGTGPNNNKLFNMMRGLEPHPGGLQCTTETAPFCAVLQEWYRNVFGEGVLTLGRVNDISPSSGTVSGWAGSSSAPTTSFKVRFYLDGESGKVAMLGESTANLEANDNDIAGPHGFSFTIPGANVDNKPHKLYAYAVDGAGKESAMAGSPYTYTVFKPKNSATATNLYAQITANCNGNCHSFTYATRWSTLLGGYGTSTWSSTNNTLYNKFASGQHGGGAFNGNAAANTAAWFKEEFTADTGVQ